MPKIILLSWESNWLLPLITLKSLKEAILIEATRGFIFTTVDWSFIIVFFDNNDDRTSHSLDLYSHYFFPGRRSFLWQLWISIFRFCSWLLVKPTLLSVVPLDLTGSCCYHCYPKAAYVSIPVTLVYAASLTSNLTATVTIIL